MNARGRGRIRLKLSLVATGLTLAVAVVGAVNLVPRVRPVEIITLFASAFGAGAALVVVLRALRDERDCF